MAGDTNANKRNTNRRQGVQFSNSAKPSVNAVHRMQRAKGTPVARMIETTERVARRKRRPKFEKR